MDQVLRADEPEVRDARARVGIEAADVTHLAVESQRHAQRFYELCEGGNPRSAGVDVMVGIDVRRIAAGQRAKALELCGELVSGIGGIVDLRAVVDEVKSYRQLGMVVCEFGRCLCRGR